jgi:hypothetical protein
MAVSFAIAAGKTYTVSVDVVNATGSNAYLVGYIDFNKDGDFLDTGEQSATVTAATSASYNVSFTTPAGMTDGINTDYYAQVAVGGGKYGLWAGDVNRSRTVTTAGASNDSSYVDARVFLEGMNITQDSNYIVQGYDMNDSNLDGKVITSGDGNDRGIVQFNVISHPYNGGNPNMQANQNFIIYRQYP